MALIILLLLVSPAALLIVSGAILPRSAANASAKGMSRWVNLTMTAQLSAATLLTIFYVWQALFSIEGRPSGLSESVWGISVYFDGVSCLMFLMVSFIGWVICRYSVQYLDGDASQGNYFRWVGFTLGAVSLMVVSGNLLMLFAAWLMTSFGLHHLLLHFPENVAAKRAAWTKFTVSRIGDLALGFALVLIYSDLGTLQIADLFARIETMGPASANLQAAAFLLIAAAAIKSAQFPFHTWLPQTLETPTPVSALMHAGIVNAGGYLIVRTSPIVSLAPLALTLLAIVGAITAFYAATVMLTQTSVKKSLAYSTIAQMGFMMLQCGLGAFSAAMLHILAHSMYKAYAFLDSGSVIAGRSPGAAQQWFERNSMGKRASWVTMMMAAMFTLTCLVISLAVFGIDPVSKPGGLILGAVLCLALTHWIGRVAAEEDGSLLIRGGVIAGGLCVAYAASYSVVDAFTSPSVPTVAMPLVQWAVVAAIVLGGFGSLFLIERGLLSSSLTNRLNAWQVHAANGFYVESTLRRVFGPLSSS